MPLSDQQLRQELLGFGETVPPITQRNREQLRARLEVLRGQPRSRTAAGSPSRARFTAADAASTSPSKARLPASPTRARVASSPSRARAAAITNSPSRTRTNATIPAAATARPSTRSKGTKNLIELSDSETDAATIEALATRSAGPNTRTRSSLARRQLDSPNSSLNSGVPTGMTNDVEQSIARHRREIKQLLDSARDRTRVTSTAVANSSQVDPPPTTPLRPLSASTLTNLRSSPEKPEAHFDLGKRLSQDHLSPGKSIFKIIKNILKLLLVSSLLIGAGTFLIQKSNQFFPPPKDINCSTENIVACSEMKPVIDAVRKQLRIRTGEVECGFRTKEDLLISRTEIERHLDEKRIVFTHGTDSRWQSIIKYILSKPEPDILTWNENNQPINEALKVTKLSTKTAIRSLTCEARQNIDTKVRNLVLILIGSTGLLTLVWFLQRRSKEPEDNEEMFKKFLNRTIDLLEEQYEKHKDDPQTDPWLTISHIRDKLIPDDDQPRLKSIWERVQTHINEQESRVRSASQLIRGQQLNVWEWIKSNTSSPTKNLTESPKKSNDETYVYTPTDVGLTECLKLRNFFGSETDPDEKKIDQVVDDVQKRCSPVKRIEHIGIHSVFVYLKFSSKEAAANGYHLLNNWKYNGEDINAKYVRLNRYYDHFPEAQDSNANN